jgi:hypothetical protein
VGFQPAARQVVLVVSKISRNSLLYFTCFVASGICSEENVQKKSENEEIVFRSRQCSSTPVGFGEEFLSKGYMTTLEHPHLATDNFYLFS